MMLQKICIYNSKIFITLQTHLVGYYYNKYSESQNKRFKEYLKLKIPVECSNEIYLDVVHNNITGLKSLIIFVFDLKNLLHVFIYNDSYEKRNKKRYEKGLYEISLPIGPVFIEDYSTRFFVSDGPTFLLQSSDSIHLFSVLHHKNVTFDSVLLSKHCKEYKTVQFKCFGPFRALSLLRFITLVVIFYDFCGEQRIKVVGFVSDSQNFAANYELLPLCLFFPEWYETLLKAVEVVKVLPHFKTELLSFKDVEWKEIISVTCTENECLVFHNSVLLYCCKLTESISKVMAIDSEFSYFPSENTQLVLKLENNSVFFIMIKKKIICEVVKHLIDLKAALIGDIVGKGSKQVLLLKETSITAWQNNCILYDMLSFLPVELLCHNTMPDECLTSTISGLERKVLNGKSVYQEIEQEISQKSAAIIDALIKLKDFRVNRELLKHSNVFQESLVDLLLSKDENKTESFTTESKPSIKLLERKGRFINSHYVLNLLFKNDSEKSICNPSIKVLMQESQVSSIQKLFIHSLENLSPSDKYSCQINQKGKFTIRLGFELPVSFVEDVDLILTWYDGSKDEFENDIFIKDNQKVLLQHQLCLQTKVTLSDILNPQLETGISSPSDVLFWKLFQQKTKLCISSLYSSINSLEELLRRINSPSQNLYSCRSSTSKCIMFSNKTSYLFGVNIVYHSSEQNILEIEVYAENEPQILLTIQYLYEHLPDDVIILPELNFKDELLQLKREAANSMKSELDLIVSSLIIHNISEEVRMNYSKLLSSQMAGTLTIPKTTYNRIRTVLAKKEYITDSIFKRCSFNLNH